MNDPKVVISDIDISFARMIEIIIKFNIAIIVAMIPFFIVGYAIGYFYSVYSN
jgi:hypothetical protein